MKATLSYLPLAALWKADVRALGFSYPEALECVIHSKLWSWLCDPEKGEHTLELAE